MENKNHIEIKSKLVEGGYLHCSLTAPPFEKRHPLNISFVIDVSLNSANISDSETDSTQQSFEQSLINQIQPLLTLLNEEDNVSFVITKSSNNNQEENQRLKNVLSRTKMNEEGKKQVISFITQASVLCDNNNTTQSIETALDQLANSSDSYSSLPIIILITDLSTHQTDSQSLISRINQKISKNQYLESVSLNTVGINPYSQIINQVSLSPTKTSQINKITYTESNQIRDISKEINEIQPELDGFLLLDLAKQFRGQFTILENNNNNDRNGLQMIFTNLLLTYSNNVCLDVNILQSDIKFSSINPTSQLLSNTLSSDQTHLSVNIGPVFYEKIREILIRLDSNNIFECNDLIFRVEMSYDLPNREQSGFKKITQSQEIRKSDLEVDQTIKEVLKQNFVDYTYSNIKKYQNGIKSFAVSALITLAVNLTNNSQISPELKQLALLLKDQITTTFSKEQIFKIKKNSLLSIIRSHLLQLQSIDHESLIQFSDKLNNQYLTQIQQAHNTSSILITPTIKTSPKKQEINICQKVKSFDMYEAYESTRH